MSELTALTAADFIGLMKKLYHMCRTSDGPFKFGPMQYGGEFYKMCEEFGLDPDEVKKEIENE